MVQTVKILAIESEEIILKSVQKALKNNPEIEYIITTSFSAVEGLKIVRNNTFDIILMDLVLPGINGIELFKRIRKINPMIPIIIFSGYSSKSISLYSIAEGSTDILLKPFTAREIRSIILKILHSKFYNKSELEP